MRLREWIEREDRNANWLAREIGRRSPRAPSGQAARKWIKNQGTPSLEWALVINEITDNEVTLQELIATREAV